MEYFDYFCSGHIQKTKVNFIKTTEQESNYEYLENMSISDILTNINQEDQIVPMVVKKAIPQIEAVVKVTVNQLKNGGRLFYIGAGTSGRMGILDASECPPTYGVSPDLVIGIIAGGDKAIRTAVENAEDDILQGWYDLQTCNITNRDIVIGIAASGTTPYVINALKECRQHHIPTACITSNAHSPITKVCDYPIEVVVGPEFITGSSRMKAGTAQKLVLNMISTSTMIQLGRVKGNRMVDMKITNDKLAQRGINMLQQELKINFEEAEELLKQYKNVREAINIHLKNK